VTPRNQLFAQDCVVIDFSIKNDPNRAVFIADGLMSAGDIHDAQAAHANSDVALRVDALIVGPSMDHGSAHPPQNAFIHPCVPVTLDYPSNSTHLIFPDDFESF
jgi:hypothetical protein